MRDRTRSYGGRSGDGENGILINFVERFFPEITAKCSCCGNRSNGQDPEDAILDELLRRCQTEALRLESDRRGHPHPGTSGARFARQNQRKQIANIRAEKPRRLPA